MKVIVINSSGFSEVTAELTSLSEIRNNYSYEVWELSEIYNMKGVYKNIPEAQTIHSISDFEQRLEKETRTDQVVIVTNMTQSALCKVYFVMKKFDIVIVDMQKNNFMCFLEQKLAFDFNIHLPIKTRLKRILNTNYFVRYINKLIRYKGVKFDYLLSAYNFFPEETRHFVKTHNTKYDEYLKCRDSSNPIGNEFILFIDSATCYHPNDYKGEDPNFDVNHHLQQLNDYFQALEDRYKVPVVVSLHPCSVGRLTEEDFCGRKVTYSQTALLIQHAKFVVSFFSTSLINVLLSNKPSLILTSNEVVTSKRGRQEACAFILAKMCGFTIDSMDNPLYQEPSIDKEKYDSFCNKYLINREKQNTSNGDMLVELLKSLEA